MKPKQGLPVLIILKDGSTHEGHWLKNANYKEKNVNRWRIYKTGKTVPDNEVLAWIDLEGIIEFCYPARGTKDVATFRLNAEKFKVNWNLEIQRREDDDGTRCDADGPEGHRYRH